MSERIETDVLVVGSGLAGAVVARDLLDAGLRVTVVDAGDGAASRPGAHVADDRFVQRDPTRWQHAISARLARVSISVGEALDGAGPAWSAAQPRAGNVPAAAVCRAVGGMGTIWSCLAPRLAEHERFPWAEEWERAYAGAEAALGVSRSAFASEAVQERIVAALRRADLDAEPAPLSIRAEGDRLRFTAAEDLLRGVALAPRARLLPGHAVRTLEHREGVVREAVATRLEDGRLVRIQAVSYVVAAGAILGPQLLFASGIHDGEGSALGRYFMDHPLVHGQALLDESLSPPGDGSSAPNEGRARPRFAVTAPPRDEAGDRVFVMQTAYDARPIEGRADPRRVASVYLYGSIAPRRYNRVRFDRAALDPYGLPRPIFEVHLSSEEKAASLARIGRGKALVKLLGEPLVSAPMQSLAPGSSMHVMGTTRMGATDDGTSVVDQDGRVWGFANLHLAGTGIIPTATVTNPTLTAAAIARWTARRIADSLLGIAPTNRYGARS